MRNQTSFRLTTTLLPTDTTAKTTQVINKVDADGNQFYPTFTEETVVITNDDRTIMETTRASCSNGVLTFVKRGLSDDSSATEITNRKLTWNPGSICFITAGASDMVDLNDDNYWTGKQTYTGDMEAQGKATYKGKLITEKGVQYPSFADTTALQAYSDPFGGMFATVEDTGELYRYNAVTEQWDLVSTVDLGTYEIRADDEKPAPGTADTIVTIVNTEGEIYLGETLVSQVNVDSNLVDLLVVGGGGGGGGACTGCFTGGGGGGGGVFRGDMQTIIGNSFCVKVGTGGNGGCCNEPGGQGGASSFDRYIALGGGGGGKGKIGPGGNGANGGGGGSCSLGGIGFSNSLNGHNGGGSGLGAGGQGGSALVNGDVSVDVTAPLGVNIGGCDISISAGGGGGRCAPIGCTDTHGSMCQCYGSGGGGGSICDKNGDSGKGGVVMVAYPSDGSYGFSCATGGTVSCCCINGVDYCIHTFTSDGTFCIVS